jgi:hypothetical protein
MRVLLPMLCLLLSTALAWAVLPTDADYQTLKTDITVTNQAEFAQFVAAANYAPIVNAYNAEAPVECWVYKTVLTLREVCQDTAPSGALWDWTVYIANLTADDKDAFKLMFSSGNGQVDPSKPNVQTAIAKIFKGTAAPIVAQRAFLDEVFRRKARRIEKLYVSGGACTTVAPSTMRFTGTITDVDVVYALIPGAPHP